ncbi:MAG: hypothetical protein A2931_03765 [Candidatus Niyogibacteria bacterium RIFCSPLOWO2_01_FULL_45_48]|uniref:Transcriptional repressor PaaX-like central Cas2-like domain-containing protein n=2 Tax=Candidatus Niyogiibacteriota TaxID=1817912 RepID=A0A1G2EZ12_9BACT|nr:MAG: hypothetical protein A2835_00495 [Candidatus Niyogibacteria bacterium RIFCSPHIGHO2_01_FULL_45_28]OGZ30630.1 MAG: hypothetical protein A3J00_00460 [Candidatus Niyogibacteria bacterium RIFCSPLOWO2_02_FULL_45_13]OGZ31491.1 MAG: hypothetical protein A2931_03765 [Candidatus Niyogibacteria bacterium RIFCSPLOWO2_01_FULL_45_48]
MPKSKPLRFKSPDLPEKIKEQFKKFINDHPTTTSAAKVLFGLAVFGGVLTAAVVVPGVVSTIGRSTNNRKVEERKRYARLWQNFYRMKKEHSLVFCKEENGADIYEFTKNGEKKFRRFVLETLKIEAPLKWDGNWRIIIFDIPENRRLARRSLQRKLSEIGCYPLQKSVWVHPFPCEEEIEFIKDVFNVKPFVYVLKASEMPNGKVLYHYRQMLKSHL